MENVLNWILDNWSIIASVVGSAYAAARVLVITTKTKKDDEYLDRFDRIWLLIVRIAARAFGLREDEGRK